MFTTRLILALLAALTLSACGVSFTPQTVTKNDTELSVAILELTPKVISEANSSRYSPLSLPAVFNMSAGVGVGRRGLDVLPQPPVVPRLVPPSGLELRVPPKEQVGPYLIGVGDSIALVTNASEQASGLGAVQSQRQVYIVRDDGAIAIPEVGAVAIAGLTAKEAEEQVFKRFVQYQIDPEFSLEISEYNSKRVTVGGAVANPINIAITASPLQLASAITAAGGLALENRDYASIHIYRDGTLYQIPLKDYFADQRLQKVFLANGDSVFVDVAYDLSRAQAYYEQEINSLELRQRARASALAELRSEIEMRRATFNAQLELSAIDRQNVFLVGEVAQQGLVPLPFEHTISLAEVLLKNGGVSTSTGNPAHVYVVRASDDDSVIAFHLDARNVVNLTLASRLEMRPDDIVFVKAQPITTWGRALQQAFGLLLNAGANSL